MSNMWAAGKAVKLKLMNTLEIKAKNQYTRQHT